MTDLGVKPWVSPTETYPADGLAVNGDRFSEIADLAGTYL